MKIITEMLYLHDLTSDRRRFSTHFSCRTSDLDPNGKPEINENEKNHY